MREKADWLAYRGVGAITQAAGVELGVLDRVRRQVHLQAGRIRVTTITVVAFVRLILVVLPAVGLWQSRRERSNVRKHFSFLTHLSKPRGYA